MKRILTGLALALLTSVALAADNAVIVTPGAGVTMRTTDVGSLVQSPNVILSSITGAAIYGTAGTANANVLSVQGIASMTPLLVTATQSGGWTVAATQSGTWNITNVSGTVSLPTGASTSANQPSAVAAAGAATSGSTGNLAMGAVTTGSPTYTTANTNPLSLDTSGNLRVNVVAGGAGGGAVTVADGADVTQGAKADAVCGTATGTCSMTALTKFVASAVAGPLPAGSNLVGQTGNTVGGTNTAQISCATKAFYDSTPAGSLTQIIALSGSTVIYICGYAITTGATATNVGLSYGTGSNCATGTQAITPAFRLAANSGLVDHVPIYNGLQAPAGNALCVSTSANNPVQVIVYYTQY